MSTMSQNLYLYLLVLLSSTLSLAQVPPSVQFKIHINESEVGQYISEYDASYRIISGPDFFRFPFQLFFYNTTPGAYVFGLRMGIRRVESMMYWVWDANRNDPVGENSTLSFGQDGNLLLTEPDGRIAWQTGTANIGVTGYSLLQTGNFVLHDKNGRLLWQSFDHPTDTLLANQSLRTDGPNKLVSRTSAAVSSDGAYSLVIEPSGFHMYMANLGQRLLYGGWDESYGKMRSITFTTSSEDENGHAFDLLLNFEVVNVSQTGRHLNQVRKVGGPGFINLARPNYNATYSFLRLGTDGNLRAFTYYDKVSIMAWEETFAFFSKDFISECALPSKCGSLGLCEKGMCVACPQLQGLLGWSQGCKPPKLPPCSKKNVTLNYYKVKGVEHFSNQYVKGEGPVGVEECRERCSKDCKCVGFSYWEESSKCWLVPVLSTLIKVSQSSHTVYIKYSNNLIMMVKLGVFTPLSEPLIEEEGEDSLGLKLLAKARYSLAKFKSEEIVILSQVLANEVNIGYEAMGNQQVLKFNGTPIRNIRHLAHLVDSCKDKYLIFEFEENFLAVLEREAAAIASPSILKEYGIPCERSTDLLEPYVDSSVDNQSTIQEIGDTPVSNLEIGFDGLIWA